MSNAAFTVKYRGNTFIVNRDGGVQRVFDDKISERLAPSAEFEAFVKGNQGARQRMNIETEYAALWNYDNPVADFGIDVPAWVDQEISGSTIAAIVHGGCASGAYMPAVTYHSALATMNEHGDDVLEYIEGATGELPQPDASESWSGIAVHYLSIAVELWALAVEDQAREALGAG